MVYVRPVTFLVACRISLYSILLLLFMAKYTSSSFSKFYHRLGYYCSTVAYCSVYHFRTVRSVLLPRRKKLSALTSAE